MKHPFIAASVLLMLAATSSASASNILLALGSAPGIEIPNDAAKPEHLVQVPKKDTAARYPHGMKPVAWEKTDPKTSPCQPAIQMGMHMAGVGYESLLHFNETAILWHSATNNLMVLRADPNRHGLSCIAGFGIPGMK